MSNIGLEFFNSNPLSRDLFELVTGDRVGIGQYRTVYKSLLVPDEVLKFEYTAKSFSNVQEMDIWERIALTKFAKWFCPCVSISSCGTILIQKYARDVEDHEYPDEIPVFFTDVKKSNFGMYKGNFVCRDYGANLLIEKGLSNKLKKVIW